MLDREAFDLDYMRPESDDACAKASPAPTSTQAAQQTDGTAHSAADAVKAATDKA